MSNAPQEGSLIAGKYRLIRLLGRGGMGSVWEAEHTSLGSRFAIKFIENPQERGPDAPLRFHNEARAAASLQTKHVVQVFDHGETEEGQPYIVMELLGGEALDKRLGRLKRLSLQETALLVEQVARALDRAHKQNIVHRDLKPENIFLATDPDSAAEVVKILDFGIAKFASNNPDWTGTQTGTVFGTPLYMSPEQARGAKSVDARSDLWALGVIAYRCVVGQHPFEGNSPGDVLLKVAVDPIPVPSTQCAAVPEGFDLWFAKAVARDPEQRFQTASDLAQALCDIARLSRPVNTATGAQRLEAAKAPTIDFRSGVAQVESADTLLSDEMARFSAPVRDSVVARESAAAPAPAVSSTTNTPSLASSRRKTALFALCGVLACVLAASVFFARTRSEHSAVQPPTLSASTPAASATTPTQTSSPANPESSALPIPSTSPSVAASQPKDPRSPAVGPTRSKPRPSASPSPTDIGY